MKTITTEDLVHLGDALVDVLLEMPVGCWAFRDDNGDLRCLGCERRWAISVWRQAVEGLRP